MRKRILSLLLCFMVVGVAMAGGQTEAGTTVPEVSIFWRIGAYPINPDNPIVQAIEERSGIRPLYQNVPWNAYGERLNLAVASGDMADITINNGPNNPNVAQWASEGIFLPLDDLLKDAPNIRAKMPAELMDAMVADDGNTYWIPRLLQWTHVFLMRDDWLDKYGVTAPKTLDDFMEVGAIIRDGLKRDGIEDAYVYGGFGFLFWSRWVSTAYGLPVDQFKKINGEWKFTSTVPEFRQVVEYLNRMYTEGIMDPEFLILNPSQGREKFYQGRIGMAGMRIDDVIRANSIFESAGLDARVSGYVPPRSASGIGGFTTNDPYTEDGTGFWMTASIPSSSTKAKAAMQLMDFMVSDEGTVLGFWGREGIEHRQNNSGGRDWLISVEQREALGLPMYMNFISGEPRYGEGLDDPWSAEADELYRIAAVSLYRDYLIVPPTNEKMRELRADLGTFVQENLVNFVTGKRPINEFDEYIAEWYERGGRELLAELTIEMKKRGE